MQPFCGGTEAGALACADIAGDDGCRADVHGVIEAVEERLEPGKREKLVGGDILDKRFTGESESVGERNHCASSSKRLPPR